LVCFLKYARFDDVDSNTEQPSGRRSRITDLRAQKPDHQTRPWISDAAEAHRRMSRQLTPLRPRSTRGRSRLRMAPQQPRSRASDATVNRPHSTADSPLIGGWAAPEENFPIRFRPIAMPTWTTPEVDPGDHVLCDNLMGVRGRANSLGFRPNFARRLNESFVADREGEYRKGFVDCNSELTKQIFKPWECFVASDPTGARIFAALREAIAALLAKRPPVVGALCFFAPAASG